MIVVCLYIGSTKIVDPGIMRFIWPPWARWGFDFCWERVGNRPCWVEWSCDRWRHVWSHSGDI